MKQTSRQGLTVILRSSCTQTACKPFRYRINGVLLAFFGIILFARAQVPGIINYQGRLSVDGTNFNGTAQFKFTLVTTNAAGTLSLWSNDGSSSAGSEPLSAVPLKLTRGVYSVQLGDTSVPGMSQSIPSSVFQNTEVFLRSWVDYNGSGSQLLTPDRRITAVGYALVADSVRTAPAAALPSGAMLVSQLAQDPDLIAGGYRLIMTVPPPGWVNGSTTNAPSARSAHTAVWTGSSMLVWGGRVAAGAYLSSGAAYTPDSDTWATLSPIGAPSARAGHTAAWTGSELLIWGGSGAEQYVATGGRFNLSAQSWRSISTNGAPDGRSGHVAAWTGSRMLVWGGLNASGLLADGALYDPAANTWSTLGATTPPAPRMNATAVWTGDRLLVWGGEGELGPLGSGAQLLFADGSPAAWSPLSAAGAPSARSGHTAVWTGSRLLVWGGQSDGTPLGDGAAYDPATDTWQALPSAGAPAARFDHTALWTGSEMLILDGANAAGSLAGGAAYDPSAQRWRNLSATGGPLARSQPAAVWTGTEILLFGGLSGAQPVAALQRLIPQPAWHFYRKP